MKIGSCKGTAGNPQPSFAQAASKVKQRNLEDLANLVLTKQLERVRQVAFAVVQAVKDPSKGSPALNDADWIGSQEKPDFVLGAYLMGLESGMASMSAAVEQFQALQMILASDKELPLPAMGCVRSIHETVLKTCWLTDPHISSQERLARTAASFLESVQGSIPVIQYLEGMTTVRSHGEDLVNNRLGAVEALKSIGLTIHETKAGVAKNVKLGGYTANVVPKTTDLSLKYAPLAHSAWMLNSGATHSQEWLVQGLVGPWTLLVRSMILPMLDMGDALVENLCGYVGLSSDEYHRWTHYQRMALLSEGHSDSSSAKADWKTYREGSRPTP